MTTISIVPEARSATVTEYRAIAGRRQSLGKTPGEALDALSSQLSDEESGTLLVVQQMRPDRFFTAEQQNRLGTLMNEWREARDHEQVFPPEKQTELERLIQTELEATTKRAMAMVNDTQP